MAQQRRRRAVAAARSPRRESLRRFVHHLGRRRSEDVRGGNVNERAELVARLHGHKSARRRPPDFPQGDRGALHPHRVQGSARGNGLRHPQHRAEGARGRDDRHEVLPARRHGTPWLLSPLAVERTGVLDARRNAGGHGRGLAVRGRNARAAQARFHPHAASARGRRARDARERGGLAGTSAVVPAHPIRRLEVQGPRYACHRARSRRRPIIDARAIHAYQRRRVSDRRQPVPRDPPHSSLSAVAGRPQRVLADQVAGVQRWNSHARQRPPNPVLQIAGRVCREGRNVPRRRPR